MTIAAESSVTYAIAEIVNGATKYRWRIVALPPTGVPGEFGKPDHVLINDDPALFSSRRIALLELARIKTAHDVFLDQRLTLREFDL